MLNILRHFREFPVKCRLCRFLENAEYTETLQGNVSESCRMCRVGRQC